MPNASAGTSKLEQKLRSEITGDVFFDPFNRGRYATDASFYQIIPAGVVGWVIGNSGKQKTETVIQTQ